MPHSHTHARTPALMTKGVALAFVIGAALAAPADSARFLSAKAGATVDEAAAGPLAAAELRFSNGGEFEDVSGLPPCGPQGEYLPHAGFNGSGGLRLKPANGKPLTYDFKTDFFPDDGKSYTFSLLYKPNGKVKKVEVIWSAQDTPTHNLCGNWINVGRKDMGAGWTKVTSEVRLTNCKRADVKTMRFFVVVWPDESDPSVTVDFDSVLLEENAPAWTLACLWPTHHSVWNDVGRLRLHSFFTGDFVPKGVELRYALRLCAGGRTLARATVTATNGVLTADFGRLGFAGAATLEVACSDGGTKVYGRKTLPMTVRSSAPQSSNDVVVAENGVVTSGGKSFMPVGFYTSFGQVWDAAKTARDLKRIREMGGNVVMEYWIATMVEQGHEEAFLAMCAANGVRVLYNLTGYVHHPERLESYYRPLARRLSKNPALCGWYILDEASKDQLPAIGRLRRMLNEETPGLPTVQCNIHEPEPYLGVSDILGGDHYAIGLPKWGPPSLGKTDAYMRQAAACRAAAMWYCPQCMNWANYEKGALEDRETYLKVGREPTENAMLSIALLYASYGVSGFVFYSWADIERGPVPELYARRLGDVTGMMKKIRALEPFVMGGRPVVEVPTTDEKGACRAVVLESAKGERRLLVIGLSDENACTFALPRGLRGESLCGRTVRTDGGMRFSGGAYPCDILR